MLCSTVCTPTYILSGHYLELDYGGHLVDRHMLSYLASGVIKASILEPDCQIQLAHSNTIYTRDEVGIWTDPTLGFHAFLREGEFSIQVTYTYRYSPTHHLLERDVKMVGDHFTVRIQSSKTDPFSTPCTVPVAATDTTTCPV